MFFMKLSSSFILLLFVFSVSSLFSQNRVVHGKVVTLDTLAVANFVVKAKKSGAQITTDTIGRFSILTEQKDLLYFKGKVFRNKKMRINEKTPDTLLVHVDFIITPENKKIAIGYGYIPEDQLINAVSHLGNNQMGFCHYNNIFELIRGKVPGVEVVGGGMEPDIIIRGISSINLSSCALYVLDGTIVTSIGHINPCDVKNINVIKDSGASIYGSRGANGVVLIETKRGERVVDN